MASNDQNDMLGHVFDRDLTFQISGFQDFREFSCNEEIREAAIKRLETVSSKGDSRLC